MLPQEAWRMQCTLWDEQMFAGSCLPEKGRRAPWHVLEEITPLHCSAGAAVRWECAGLPALSGEDSLLKNPCLQDAAVASQKNCKQFPGLLSLGDSLCRSEMLTSKMVWWRE